MKGIDDRIIAGDFNRCVYCLEYDPDPMRGCPLVPVTIVTWEGRRYEQCWDPEADELKDAEWVD